MRIAALVLAGLLLGALALRRRRPPAPLAALALLATAGLAVYGSGVVHFPDLEHAIRSVGPSLGRWTYALVGVLAFLESGAFVGLVAPGEFAVIFGGFVAGQGLIDPFLLAGLVTASATAGDLASLVLGRRLGRAFLDRHGRHAGLDGTRLAALERYYERHGGKTIVVGRFVGIARALSPFVAGASRMPLRRFLVFDLPAALLWSATFVALGFLSWESFDRAVVYARRGNLALGIVIAAVVVVAVSVRLARSPDARRRLTSRLRPR